MYWILTFIIQFKGLPFISSSINPWVGAADFILEKKISHSGAAPNRTNGLHVEHNNYEQQYNKWMESMDNYFWDREKLNSILSTYVRTTTRTVRIKALEKFLNSESLISVSISDDVVKKVFLT